MSSWLDQARQLPLAFAQVREDPLIDQAVVQACGRPTDIAMVASGGCTAALLAATAQVSSLHLIDPNPAQLALTQVKLRLLQTSPPAERRRVLGRAAMPADSRARALAEHCAALRLADEVFGPRDLVARLGPDQAGRYEAVFRAIASDLHEYASALDAVLTSIDTQAASAAVAAGTVLGQAIAATFRRQFDLAILVSLFGSEATRNPVRPFTEHFLDRIRHAVATLPARDNHFLHQMLRAEDPAGGGADWLDLPITTHLPPVTCSRGLMGEVLAAATRRYDVVHLSNILDWLTPAAAQATLDAAVRALRPGGLVVIRQLNSTIDPLSLATGLVWDQGLATRLQASDRSFFYRRLLIGRRS